MFGGRIKHPFKFLFRGLLYRLILGRLLALPASIFTPKKKNRLLFIGRDDGQFIDNVKYLFLYVNRIKPPDLDVYFLTENADTFRQLQDNQL